MALSDETHRLIAVANATHAAYFELAVAAERRRAEYYNATKLSNDACIQFLQASDPAERFALAEIYREAYFAIPPQGLEEDVDLGQRLHATWSAYQLARIAATKALTAEVGFTWTETPATYAQMKPYL